MQWDYTYNNKKELIYCSFFKSIGCYTNKYMFYYY